MLWLELEGVGGALQSNEARHFLPCLTNTPCPAPPKGSVGQFAQTRTNALERRLSL